MELPILSRELVVFQKRNGKLYLSDYYLVNTELGAGVEQRLQTLETDKLPTITANMVDFDKITIMDENEFYTLTNHSGAALPFNLT